MPRRQPYPRFLLPAAILIVALLPAALLGRAGGGEGFNGGGGGDGGGGNGGGDSGLIQLLFWVVLRYPAVGVPLVVIVIIGYIIAQRKGVSAYQGSVIRRGSEASDQLQRQTGLLALAADDPQFNQDAFLQRVRGAFTRTQAAWSVQDLAAVRPFLSDGVFERFNLQFAEQKTLGYRNAMDNLQVQACSIEQIELDDVYQTICVQLTASADDSYISIPDGKRLPGPGSTAPFSEIWSFLRKRGAQSKLNADGLIEGHCPNCGAAIEMNQNAQCGQCGSLLRSGQYDWVLTAITQASEWRGETQSEVPGVAALRVRDPGFAVQSLEDAAGVMFWRLMAAQRLGRIDPARKIATEQFCEQWGQGPTPPTPRTFFVRCGVGSVRTLGIGQVDGWDRAVVEIVWSGTRYSGQADGTLRPAGASGAIYWLLLLQRRSDTVTSLDKSVASAHCPNCGAPQSNSVSNACDSCGTVLNDGSRSWVLAQQELTGSAQGQIILSDLRQQTAGAGTGVPTHAPGSLSLLAWIVKMAAADGQIADAEQQLISDAAGKWDIPTDQLNAMIASASQGTLEAPQPQDRDEARLWMSEMANMALADGKIDATEAQLLRKAGAWCGYSDYDLNALLKASQQQLLAESRVALRQMRQTTAR